MGPVVHDVPVLGVLTTSFADAFAGVVWAHPTEEELRDAFDKADDTKSGKLCRTGVADALRHLDKADRQIQKMVDRMPAEELDFEAFRELVVPGPLPWTWECGPLPIPNHEKILDTPVLGNTLNMTNDLMALPFDDALRSFRKSQFPASDKLLAETFSKVDADGNKKLDKKELGPALRKFYKTESEIKSMLDAMTNDVSLYEFKKMVRGPKYSPSVVNYVPMLGPALATNLLSAFDDGVPEEDQREAFEYLDRSKTGKLDKTEVGDLLRELGKSEAEVQRMVNAMPAEELDFQAFKEFLESGGFPARSFTTDVYGYPVPNPAKVHDVPLIGTVTSLTQDILVDTYDWTAGSAFRYFKRMDDEELKAKFDELDTSKTGTLDQKEIAKGLRSLGMTEREIKSLRDSLGKDQALTFEEFQQLVRTGQASIPSASSEKGSTSPALPGSDRGRAEAQDTPADGAQEAPGYFKRLWASK